MSFCNSARLAVEIPAGESSDPLDLDLYQQQGRSEILLSVTSSQDLSISGRMGGKDDEFSNLPHQLEDQAHSAGSKTYVLPVNPGARKFRFVFSNDSVESADLVADAGALRS
jgi:hypothetical protein